MNIENAKTERFAANSVVTARRRLCRNAITKGLVALTFVTAVAAQEAEVTPLTTQELTGMSGKEVTMLTVAYPPGGTSTQHRHNAHVFVYVVEGSVVMGVKGGKEVTLGPGQTFYESPEDVHTVSRNASDTKPAKFVVFFVKEKGVPLSVPVPESKNK